MVFCNSTDNTKKDGKKASHNPYFNRWFSAILKEFIDKYVPLSHNPYFNRWFSAI